MDFFNLIFFGTLDRQKVLGTEVNINEIKNTQNKRLIFNTLND